MQKTNKPLLIDTHVWIWFAEGAKDLSQSEIDIIEAHGTKGNLFVSTMSTWEVAMLESRGRLVFDMPCIDWVKRSLERMNAELMGISPEIAVESCNLPGNFHGDPADRLIVATARINECSLITHDEKIKVFGSKNYVSIC